MIQVDEPMRANQAMQAGRPMPVDKPRISAAGATMSVPAAVAWACRRDLYLAARSRAELAVVLLFFLLVASLFPLAVSPDPSLLRAIAPRAPTTSGDPAMAFIPPGCG